MNVFGIRFASRVDSWNGTTCESCCGTCGYSTYDKVDGYICVNGESEYAADFVEYEHTCDCWERKK